MKHVLVRVLRIYMRDREMEGERGREDKRERGEREYRKLA